MSSIDINNILLRGAPGVGKTHKAKSIAYSYCKENLRLCDAINRDDVSELDAIEGFIHSNQCEFIQIHPSVDYSDLVYGPAMTADGSINVIAKAKRLIDLCNRAAKSTKRYCIILDDADRVDIKRLLGGFLYGLEKRDETYTIDGISVRVPNNVLFIATENSISNATTPLDSLISFIGVYDIKASRDVLIKHYSRTCDDVLVETVLHLFDGVNQLLKTKALLQGTERIPELGHGYFMVPISGTPRMVCRKLQERFRYQIIPYFEELSRNGLIGTCIEELSRLDSFLNVGSTADDRVATVRKRLEGTSRMPSFSFEENSSYFASKLASSMASGVHRWVIEYLIDAIFLNGILPRDVAISCLLTNTNIGRLPCPNHPGILGSFLLNKDLAKMFEYTTPGRTSRVSHGFYGRTPGSCAVAPHNETSLYDIQYTNGVIVEYYPLSGVRSHSFSLNSIDRPELSTENNAAVHLRAVYRLLSGYISLYKTCLELSPKKPGDDVLIDYLNLESKYLRSIPDALSASGVTGDSGKTAYFCKHLTELRSLWCKAGSTFDVSKSQFSALKNNQISFSVQEFQKLFKVRNEDALRIRLRRIDQMININDYQSVMENIDVRQMIFQGPPGTSKTFEAKRFILEQLSKDDMQASYNHASQKSISDALDTFRLDSADYSDPEHSAKLMSGGWDLVQFHPSYGYEDFVRGIDVEVKNGSPSYRTANRVIGQIAEFARLAARGKARDKAPRFYLLIDEINRANLATVFGELIYGLEYRDSSVSTPYEVLDLVDKQKTRNIELSSNLYIIGTMNTADKSIDTLDYAIRRRFIFIDCPPKREIVCNAYRTASGRADDSSLELLLFDSVQRLFDNRDFFNPDYRKEDVRIGHTFFLRKAQANYLESCIERFVFQVIPIIREYINDGIFEQLQDSNIYEHTPDEIAQAVSTNRISLLSESIMAIAQEFNDKDISGKTIDNAYISNYLIALNELLDW